MKRKTVIGAFSNPTIVFFFFGGEEMKSFIAIQYSSVRF